MDEFSENFRRGGGVISDLKNFIAIFFALEKAILVMNFRKKLRKFSAGATGLRKKSQYFFSEKGAGGGRSGAVRKCSGNSSVLVYTGFPYQGCTYCRVIVGLSWIWGVYCQAHTVALQKFQLLSKILVIVNIWGVY